MLFLARVVAGSLIVALLTSGLPAQAEPSPYIEERRWTTGQDAADGFVGIDVASNGNVGVVAGEFATGFRQRFKEYTPTGDLVQTFDLANPTGETLGTGNPRGFEFAADGTLLVADPVFGQVRIVLRDGSAQRLIGPELSSDVGGLTTDSAGVIYVANGENVLRIQPDGTHTAIGTYGTGPGQFERATDVAIGTDGLLYVVDNALDRVSVFTPDGGFVRLWGQAGELTLPTSIETGPNGSLFVGDLNQLHEYTPAGEPLGVVGAGVFQYGGVAAFAANGALYRASQFTRGTAQPPNTGGIARFVLSVPTQPPPPPGAGEPVIKLKGKRIDANKTRRTAKATLTCSVARCTGRVAVRSQKGILARGAYRLAAGTSGKAKAKLTKDARALLSKTKSVKVTLVLMPLDGTKVTAKARLTR